jgi:hypothetical protein
VRPRNYNSPEIQAIVDRWEIERPAWEAEDLRQRAREEERLLKQRTARYARKAKRAEWTAGVAKIMAEVRRRETERATADLCQWDGKPLPSITFRSEERAP